MYDKKKRHKLFTITKYFTRVIRLYVLLNDAFFIFQSRRAEIVVELITIILFFVPTASNLLRLSYQGPTSCSVLVDENGGVTDSLATPKSSNRTRTLENTGRWRRGQYLAEAPPSARRSKRSVDRPPSDWLDGNGDGTIATVHGNGFRPRTLDNARPINALPRQMYDAMMKMSSEREPQRHRPRRHRKRNAAADVVVYRKSDSPEAGDEDEAVDIVPLDTEHRIRVNLTIASDDPGGSPMYSVSLSLPGAPQQPGSEETVTTTRPVETVPRSRPLPVPSAGTECECFCPCFDQDDVRTTISDIVPSTVPPAEFTYVDTDASSTFTITDYTDITTSERPTAEHLDVSCPPPVLLFCETGKSPHPSVDFGCGATTKTANEIIHP